MQSTKAATFIKECIDKGRESRDRQIIWIGQDRFHASHNFGKHLLSSAPGHHEVLIDLRQSCTISNNQCRSAVFSAVLTGALKKRCTFRGCEYSTEDVLQLDGPEARLQRLVEWEVSGVLHEMFSTSPTCLLPEGMVDAATLDRQMDAFQARTRARIWSADGALSFIPSLPYPLSGIFPLIPSLLSRIPSLPYPLSSVSPLSLIPSLPYPLSPLSP